MSKKKSPIVYTSFDEGAGPKNRTQIWKECESSVRAWCDRMGAELYNLPKRPFQPQWVIYDGFEHSLETGRRSAWIDCDIFVARDAPNIFELPDRFYFCQPDPTRRIHPRMRRQWRRYGAVNPRPYLVSALAMWSPKHVRRMVKWFHTELAKEKQRFGKADGDQELLTVAVQETETYTGYFPPFWHKMERFIAKDTFFMHAAGKRKFRKIRRYKRMEQSRFREEDKK